MTFDLNFFLAAIGLLWLPLPYVARKDRAYNGRLRITPSTVSGLWRAWQNWVDLARGAVGTYLLLHLSVLFDPAGADASMAGLVKEGVLFVGLLIQTIRFGSGQGILAPLFYLTGVTLAWAGQIEGGFAVVLAWVFVCGLRDPRYLLPVLGGALLICGYFLSGLSRPLLANVGLISLPLLFALFFQRRLYFVSCERKPLDLPKEPVKPAAPLRVPANHGLKSRPSTAER